MGLILDIVDKVIPRVLERAEHEGGSLKKIIAEELQKEVGQTIQEKPLQRKNTLLKPFER